MAAATDATADRRRERSRAVTRPAAMTPRHLPTIWLDWATGQGVTDDGAAVSARISGRRQTPTLVDLLDLAGLHRAERIMLTGEVPKTATDGTHWLRVPTPGWVPAGHWVPDPPTGRFRREGRPDDPVLTVKLAREWFGDDLALNPPQVRQAWYLLVRTIEHTARTSGRPARLLHTPGATGLNLWALGLPKDLDPEPLPSDVAELLHATSGQHRQQHLTTGPAACPCGACMPMVDAAQVKSLSSFAYVDGRFMYASLGREIGGTPVTRLTAQEGADLLSSREGQYARARFHVRYQVPQGWDHVGLLGEQQGTPDDDHPWHWPNRPGYVGTAWADAAEVWLALQQGWHVEVVEGLRFTRGRWLDTWATRIVRARESVAATGDLDPVVRAAVVAALRAILIQGIGSFASRGRSTEVIVSDRSQVPPEGMATLRSRGDVLSYLVPGRPGPQGWYQPHFASQVWGRGRARVLWAPSATQQVGVLTLDPGRLIGINGDALYTLGVPKWALPVEHGGGDDGRVGRLRLQGMLAADPGRMRTPTTVPDRNRLRARAAVAGPEAAWTTHPEAVVMS